MIKVDIKNNIVFPELKLQDDLVAIADKIFIKALKRGIDQETDINGTRYPPLADSTVRSKMRKGLDSGILSATGQLRNSFYSAKAGKDTVVITLTPNRLGVGDVLQNQGVRTKKGKRFFEFFGISAKMESDAMAYIKNRISEALKKNGS